MDIFEIEPALANIVNKARAERHNNYHRRLDAYSTAKDEARYLVGFEAQNEELRNHVAWERFVIRLSDALNI